MHDSCELRLKREISVIKQAILLTLSTILPIMVDIVNHTKLHMHIASLPTPMFTLLASAAALLAGCAISTPYPQITQTKQRDPGSPIVVVITKIVISPRQRQAFNREATNVMRTLSEQPGLIGYSARRQLFGIEGWTISLWEDAAALDRFVHSDRHVRSIEASLSAIQTVSIKRLSLPLEAIPKDWPSALNLLAEPGGLRTYGW